LNGITTPKNPTLKWKKTSNTTYYEVYIGTIGVFLSGSKPYATTKNTSLQITGLKAKTRYYWVIISKNTAYQGTNPVSGPITATAQFVTGPDKPKAPTLLLPANKATKVSTKPTLTWKSSADTTSYMITIYRIAVESSTDYYIPVKVYEVIEKSLFNNAPPPTTHKVSKQLSPGEYHWFVTANNISGSTMSNGFKFSIK